MRSIVVTCAAVAGFVAALATLHSRAAPVPTENHAAAVALDYMHYNFCRIHQTLRVTPAMEAGVTDHVWGI